MFEPIQRYLPRYFNSDPEKREAVRLRAPAGTTAPWEIRDERMTIAWGDQTRVFELHDHTVSALVDALQAEGFVLDPGYDHLLLALGAVVLLEGRGTLVDFSGTPFYGFTSLLHAITRPVEREWRLFHAAIPEAVDQESLATADAEWLDVHGALYGIPRPTGMADAAYRAHLRAEVFRPRNTPRGLEHSLRRLGYPQVRVREPWQEMHYLSTDATLSGAHHLPGAPIYEYHTLQLTANAHQAWAGPLAQAEADRPAGTVMLPPATLLPPTRLGAVLAGLVIHAVNTFYYAVVLACNRYGVLSLDLTLSAALAAPPISLARIAVMALWTEGLRAAEIGEQWGGAWDGAWDERTWLGVAAAPAEMSPPLTIALSPGFDTLLAALATQQASVLATQTLAASTYSAMPDYATIVTELLRISAALWAVDSLLNQWRTGDPDITTTAQENLAAAATALIDVQALLAGYPLP